MSNHRRPPLSLLQFEVVAKQQEQRRVYGYASVAVTKDGKPIVDLQGDVIDPEDLEDTAAEFVKEYRQGGEMHSGPAPSELIASVVLTAAVQKALGIPPGLVPEAWLVGFEVPAETFAKVKEGSRLMFSIEGQAQREEITA